MQIDNVVEFATVLSDLPVGIELRSDYIGMSFENRRKKILDVYGFNCNCGYCENPDPGCKFLLQDRRCWCCRKSEPKFHCSKCGVSLYCDANCQRNNWSAHKNICTTIKKIMTYDAKDPDIVHGIDIEQLNREYQR
jgi:hypothetical protein